MKIRLVGALPRVLKDMGLKPGQVWNAEPADTGRYGAVTIKVCMDDQVCLATVYEENYQVV